MASLFDTGIRPEIDKYLAKQREEVRDYGPYWSASSAGYCQRKLIFERLGVPPVAKDSDARKYRVFESGKIFHNFIQEITRGAGMSIAQELELQDDELMVRGHIDDLVLIKREGYTPADDKLILYDYKTQNSRAFTYQKGRPASYFHRLQVGTYMYMLRNKAIEKHEEPDFSGVDITQLTEARILKMDKDSLRMDENQVLWDNKLEHDVLVYWNVLNTLWENQRIPPCTCADHEGGFMAREQFNPYFMDGEPCSIKLYEQFKLSKKGETNVG